MERKEAIEVIKKNYPHVTESGSQFETALRLLIPELKESEDEKIRKAIHIYLDWLDGRKDYAPKGEYTINDMIAWLEKRGQTFTKKDVDGAYLKGICDAKQELEKQGEQKPDKEEPEFKVGDWVVSPNGVYWHIDAINNNRYGVSSTDGACADWPLDTDLYHLWSIKDAKDGDVLEFGDHGRLVVGIVSYVNKTTGRVDVNCLLENNNFKVGNYYNLDTIKPHPAAKEQRDTLMKAMADAGYEWDAEKKELRKIEQKPTWSEEDEKRISSILLSIEYCKEQYPNLREYQYDIDWLKSLKDRVQPQSKQEWNEEDEEMHRKCICAMRASACGFPEEEKFVEQVNNWLKALKPQSTWKPSDEQMEELHNVFNDTSAGWDDNVIESLYNDLKKLREK